MTEKYNLNQTSTNMLTYSLATQILGSSNLDCSVQTSIIKSIQAIVLIFKWINFLFHHWGYTSIYWTLSYPLKFLVKLEYCMESKIMQNTLQFPSKNRNFVKHNLGCIVYITTIYRPLISQRFTCWPLCLSLLPLETLLTKF